MLNYSSESIINPIVADQKKLLILAKWISSWPLIRCFKAHKISHLCPQQQIRRELLESQLKVASLQDMSCQLLVNTEGKDCLEAKEKVHVIGNRLKMLLKDVTRHIRELEKILDISSSQLVSLFYDILITASYNSNFLPICIFATRMPSYSCAFFFYFFDMYYPC